MSKKCLTLDLGFNLRAFGSVAFGCPHSCLSFMFLFCEIRRMLLCVDLPTNTFCIKSQPTHIYIACTPISYLQFHNLQMSEITRGF